MKPKMNVRLLRRVQKKILKEPEQFLMERWYEHNPETVPNCGTAACIAGWAVALERRLTPEQARKKIYNPGTISDFIDYAASLLNIGRRDAEALFSRDAWPDDLNSEYNKNRNNHKARARIAAERIDRFIETNGEQ